MSTVSKEVYLEDVKLQMEAKLWSEEYNRHNPPKKVNILENPRLVLKVLRIITKILFPIG